MAHVFPEDFLSDRTIVEEVGPSEPELVHIAVSFAGRLLSDLGAKVVRVRPQPDPLARLRSSRNEVIAEHGVLATFLGRGKSVQQDLSGVQADLTLIGDAAPTALVEGPTVSVTAIPTGSDLEGVAVSELGVQGFVGLTDEISLNAKVASCLSGFFNSLDEGEFNVTLDPDIISPRSL